MPSSAAIVTSFVKRRAGVLVGDAHRRRHRHDLVREPACRRGRGGALLAAGAVFVLSLARDPVALRNVFGGLEHRPVDRRLVLGEPGLAQHVPVRFVLHAGDRFDAARDEGTSFTRHDPLRRDRDRLQSGGAEAIHRHAGNADRASGAQRDLPGDVRSGRAFRKRAAHHNVVDFGRIEVRPLERVTNDVAAHRRPVRHVESAAPGLGKPRAGGGHDDGVAHGSLGGKINR